MIIKNNIDIVELDAEYLKSGFKREGRGFLFKKDYKEKRIKTYSIRVARGLIVIYLDENTSVFIHGYVKPDDLEEYAKQLYITTKQQDYAKTKD